MAAVKPDMPPLTCFSLHMTKKKDSDIHRLVFEDY